MTARKIAVLVVTLAMVVSPVAGIAGATVGGVDAGTATAGNATNGTAPAGDATNATAPPENETSTSTASENETSSPTDSGEPSSTLGTGVQAKLASADSGEQVPVIVVLDEQPAERFGTNADASRIKSFARQQQSGVRDLVAAAADRGEASDVRSFWIRNALAMKATPSVVRDIAARSDVKRVVYDRPVHALGSNPTGSLGGLFEELSDEGKLAAGGDTQGFERATSGERAWGVEYIGADAVQDRGIDGSGVNVSVVDTGIDDEHPALRGQVIRWHDFVANHTDPVDPDGHGTHVAGTIAGQPGQEYAVGVAPDANLFGARALDANGGGRTSDIMAAFEWSANNSADVVSASLGIPPLTVGDGGQVLVNDTTSASRNVSVPSGLNNETGYEPASVFVAVSPNESVTNRSAAMENISVSLTGPNGETLQRYEADWVFVNGVPDTMGLWKYKPASGTVPAGNWSLSVSSTSEEPVPVDYDTLAVYPSNGTDELSRFVNDFANTTNVTPIVASGNTGFELGNRSVTSPGAAESAITVGATGYRINDVARFSARGPVGYGDEKRPGIDVIAPGVSVLSTIPTNRTGEDVPAYGISSGTSMATPHVSGVAALLLDAANGSMNRSEVRQRLTDTAQPAPDAPNAVGAGVVDAWAAVNATTDLGTQVTDPINRTELYGGLAGKYGDYGNVPVAAVEDPDDANAGAPDIWAVKRDVGEQLAVRTHDATPNATFTLYADTDRDDATGAERGAERKVVLQRWQTANGSLAGNASAYTYNAATGAYEYDGTVYIDRLHERYFALWTDGRLPASFEWHLVAENANGSDALPAQGEGQQPVPSVVNLTIPAQAVAWDTGAGAPDAGTNLTFTLTGPPGTLDRETVTTDANGSANATLVLPYNTSKYWEFENFAVEISDESGNAVSEMVEPYTKEPAIHYGEPIYEGDGLEVSDRDYRAERNETLTLNIPIHYSRSDGIVPYNGTADLRIDDNGDGVTYENVSVERGVLTKTIDLSALTSDTSYATIEVRPGDYFQWSGTISIGTWADARLAPNTRTLSPGAETNFSVQLTRSENGARKPLDGTAAYRVLWLTDVQVHSLGTNLSGGLGADLQRLATGDTDVEFSAGERKRLRSAVEKSAFKPNVSSGLVETNARGIGTVPVSAPSDAVIGLVLSRAANHSSGIGSAVVFAGDRVTGYADRPTEPTDYDDPYLSVYGNWVNASQPSSHYEVDLSYYDDSQAENVTVSLYATTGAEHTVTLDASGDAIVNLSAPTVGSSDPTGQTDPQILGVVHNRSASDGRAISDVAWVSAPYENPPTPPERTTAEPTATFENDTLRVDLQYRNVTGALTEPTWTLLQAASPSTYGTQSDAVTTYVNPNTSTPSYNFSVPVDPTMPRQFDVSTWTGVPPSWYFGTGDYVRVNGLSVMSSVPDEMVAGNETTVSLTVVDRNGQPVPNATVVWSYQTVPEQEGSTSSRFATPLDGDYRVGTTDATGDVSFDVHLDSDLGGQSIITQATASTDNVSVRGGYDYAYVTTADEPDLRSDLNAPTSVAPGENVSVNATFSNGGTLSAESATLELQFYNRSADAWETLTKASQTLDPDESFVLNATVTHNQSGYEFRARADPNDAIVELDETNNDDTAFVDVVVPTPDLVSSLDAPTSVAPGENVSVNASFHNDGTANATSATFDVQFYNNTTGVWETVIETTRELDAGESFTLNGTVTHNQSGYELRARADVAANVSEPNEDDNLAYWWVEVADSSDGNDTVELGFEPQNATVDRNGTITMNVTADTGNASLYGATTVVDYDTAVLNATAIEAGGFLSSDGANTTAYNVTIDDANGTAEISVSRWDTNESVSGTGALATVTFEVDPDASAGTSAVLSIGHGTLLSDADGNPVPYEGNYTTLTVGTTNVSVGATLFDTVLNVDSAAPVEVNASAGAPLDGVSVIGPAGESVTANPSGEAFTGTLNITPASSTWNASAGAYDEANVTAEASVNGAVARNNVSVTVNIAGDATGDGRVNIFDAVAVGTAWNASADDAAYGNGRADLNSNGEVDVSDATLLGQHWKDSADEEPAPTSADTKEGT